MQDYSPEEEDTDTNGPEVTLTNGQNNSEITGVSGQYTYETTGNIHDTTGVDAENTYTTEVDMGEYSEHTSAYRNNTQHMKNGIIMNQQSKMKRSFEK